MGMGYGGCPRPSGDEMRKGLCYILYNQGLPLMDKSVQVASKLLESLRLRGLKGIKDIMHPEQALVLLNYPGTDEVVLVIEG